MDELQILNLDGDTIIRVPSGAPVSIDAGSNVEIVLGEHPLQRLDVNLWFGSNADSLGLQLTDGGVTAPEGIAAGKPIKVGDTVIGTIDYVDGTNIGFVFNEAASPALVQQLIRAVVFADASAESGFTQGRSISLLLEDSGGNSAEALIVTTDRVVGTAGSDAFTATRTTLSSGDELAGGDGDDTLTLIGGGEFGLHLLDELSGVETIKGTVANDWIVIAGSQLTDVRRVEGGGATVGDVLTIAGTADLSSIDVVGFSKIEIGSSGGSITVDDAATAKLVTGYRTVNDKLILTEGILTADERQALHHQGVDTIVAREIEGGAYLTTTHQAPTVTNFDGNSINAVLGAAVFIDFNRDAVLTVDDGRLSSLIVHTSGTFDPNEVIGIATSARLTLSNTDNPNNKNLQYDGAVIGLVEGWGSPFLSITFNAASTAWMAQEVMRSLTYTKQAGAFAGPRTIDVSMTDVGGRQTQADITVYPTVTRSLTDGVDTIVGTDANEIFEATPENLMVAGDRLDGGGGTDTLQLITQSPGLVGFDLHRMASLTGIEIIRGSAQDDDIGIAAAQLAGVTTIDGGGHNGTTGDTLSFRVGTSFDLRGKTVTDFWRIRLWNDGTEVSVDNLETAQLVDGRLTQNDHLVLTGHDLSDAEREAYFLRGIDKITDGSGRTTENLAPSLSNIDGDRIRLQAGESVLIDVGSNVQIAGEDNDLESLSFSSLQKFGDADTFVDIRTGNGIALSNALNHGSEITVDGVRIGKIGDTSSQWELDIEFYPAATRALVEKLIKALAYKNTSADNGLLDHDALVLAITDKAAHYSEASVTVTIAPDGATVLTEGIDDLTGTDAEEAYTAAAGTITAGDRLNGGGGNDTLVLGAGTSDLTFFALFTGIETLQGSASHDTIVANAAILSGGITHIDGGGGTDRLHLAAGAYDLSDKTITGMEHITLTGNGSLTFDDRATALLAGAAQGVNATVTLTGAAFTLAERAQLFRQGITTITDASGTYANADPDGISLSATSVDELARINAVVGTLAASDPNSGDTFTYQLLNNAGGRFKLVQEGESWTIKVANRLLIDYEQAHAYTIRVKVTDQEGGFYEQNLIIAVGDVRGERATGSSGRDKLYGDIGRDAFNGGGGNDTLKGGLDNDTLNGGAGNDVLYGGSGYDKFVFSTSLSSRSNKDRIMDWNKTYDTIHLENGVFKALKKTGTLSKSFFKLGAKAGDSNDYIGYNKATGDLWYDSNGNKAGGQVVFANIGKDKAIAFNDFIVI